MIKLTVNKETFQKYLILLGYSFKINHYDSMIEAIQRISNRELNRSFELMDVSNLIDIQNRIFNKEVSLSLISDQKSITFVSKNYFQHLIDIGALDLYFEERNFTFSKSVQQNACAVKFYIETFGDLPKYVQVKYGIYGEKNLKRIKIYQCIDLDAINLDNEDILDIQSGVAESYFFGGQEFKLFTQYYKMVSSDRSSQLLDLQALFKDLLINNISIKDMKISYTTVNSLDEILEFGENLFFEHHIPFLIASIIENKDNLTPDFIRELFFDNTIELPFNLSSADENKLDIFVDKVLNLKDDIFSQFDMSIYDDNNEMTFQVI